MWRFQSPTELVVDFPGGSDGKASAYNAGDLGSIPGSGRSPGERNGNPLRYSCLENPMDGGAWWATVHGVTKSWTQLSDFTQSTHRNVGETTLVRVTNDFLTWQTLLSPPVLSFHARSQYTFQHYWLRSSLKMLEGVCLFVGFHFETVLFLPFRQLTSCVNSCSLFWGWSAWGWCSAGSNTNMGPQAACRPCDC